MKKSEILEMDNDRLMAHLIHLVIQTVKEENFSKRGLTNQTAKEYEWTMDEVCKKLNLDKQKVEEHLGF